MFNVVITDAIDSDLGSLGFAVDTMELVPHMGERVGGQKKYIGQRMKIGGGRGPAVLHEGTGSQRGYAEDFIVAEVGGLSGQSGPLCGTCSTPGMKIRSGGAGRGLGIGGGRGPIGRMGFGALGPIGRDYNPTTWAYNTTWIDTYRKNADDAAAAILALRTQIWTLGKVVADRDVIPDPTLWDIWGKSFPKLGAAADKAKEQADIYKSARSQIETKLLLAKTWYDGYVIYLIKEEYKIKAAALADIYASLRSGLDDAMKARSAQSADWRNQGINFPTRTWFKRVFSADYAAKLAKTIKADVVQVAKTGAEVMKSGAEIIGAPIAAFSWELAKTPLLIAGGIVGAILLFKVFRKGSPTPSAASGE